MASYYVGRFETAAEVTSAFIEALVSELGWTADEDGEHVRCDAGGALGLKISANTSTLAAYCCSEYYVSSTAAISLAYSRNDIYLDYAKSKAGSALIVGGHILNDQSFKGGSAVFAETTQGEKNALYMYSNSLQSLNPRSSSSSGIPSKSFSTYPSGDYTSLYRLPSFFGGLFKEVYGVFACPSTAANTKCYIDGSFYQLTYPTQGRLAVPIEN